MCRSLIFVIAFSAGFAASADVVQNVWAQQRPNTRLVDVYYDLVAPEGGPFKVSLVIKANNEELPVNTLYGDVGPLVVPGCNKHITWDAGSDWPNHIESNCVSVVAIKRQVSRNLNMVKIPLGVNEGVDIDFGYYSLTNVTDFWMDRTEITFNQYKSVFDWACANGYEFPYLECNWCGKDIAGGLISDAAEKYSPGEELELCYEEKGRLKRIACCRFELKNLPVHATYTAPLYYWAWCNARSEMDGFYPVYYSKNETNGFEVLRKESSSGWGGIYVAVYEKNNGYRLPTMLEWEYAARGGLKGCRYPWGNEINFSFANYNAIEWDYERGVPKSSYSSLPPKAITAYYGKLEITRSEEETYHPFYCECSSWSGVGYRYYIWRTESGTMDWGVVDNHNWSKWYNRPPDNYRYVDDYSVSSVQYDGGTGSLYRSLTEEERIAILVAAATLEGKKCIGKRRCVHYNASDAKTHCGTMPVASFSPNGYGLYDIVGNVGETLAECETVSQKVKTRYGTCIMYKVRKGLYGAGRPGYDEQYDYRCHSVNKCSSAGDWIQTGFRCVRR